MQNSNDSDSRLETYLNIYSEWEETEEFNIENIAQSCLNVELNYIPYKLLHTNLVIWKDGFIESKEVSCIMGLVIDKVRMLSHSKNEMICIGHSI